MPFKKIRRSNLSTETPEALYRDYRNRKIEGLLSHQADIIREYCEKAVEKSDVALQLPTGSGKTIVGLLIGEWRLKHFRERVVYLCPTNQLANQVVEQSINKYGIKANLFTGNKKEYNSREKTEYRSAETIAVTNYSSLFNIKPFFDNADVIILDDAHAAENYIAKNWSLEISRENNREIFQALISYFQPALSRAHYSRLMSQSSDISDSQWIEKIPTSKLYELSPDIVPLLDEQVKDSDLNYPWSVIRAHLSACHVYISYNTILFRPLIPPTKTHKPFSHAKQRIYMSATLGEGGELERLTGVENIERLKIPKGWDQQGIGRRFFLFPESSLDQDDSLDLIYKMIQSTNRSLVLTPDKTTESELSKSISKATQYKIFNASEIEKSKQDFITTDQAVAVVANRDEDSQPNIDTRLTQVIEGLANQLIKLGTANNRKFEAKVKKILEDLNKDGKENTTQFEIAHDNLGKLLGYEAGRSTGVSTPDPWWIVGEDLCIVFEDYSGANPGNRIGTNKVRQAASHRDWIIDNEEITLSKQAEIITVMVAPCTEIEKSAVIYAKEVCYWNITEFRKWAENAISVVRELRISFPGEADLDWRKRAITAYKDAKIDPTSLVEMLSSNKLRDLPQSN